MIESRWQHRGVVVLLAALAGCSGRDRVQTTSDDGTRTSGVGAGTGATAQVRVVNAIRSDKGVDVRAGDRTLFADVPSQSVTSFSAVAVEYSNFTAQVSGAAGTAESGNRELMVPGQFYTVVVMPGETSPEPVIRVLHEDLEPAEGKASVRVINAAPGLGEIDVQVRGDKDPLFTGVNYGSEAGFKNLDPTTATLDIRREDGKRQLLSVPDLQLDAGAARTVVVTGSPSDQLNAFTFRDRLETLPDSAGHQ